MKPVYTLLVVCLLPQPGRSQIYSAGQVILEIHSSLVNSYARGNLDDWFAYLTDDPARQVDQGSPAYFVLRAGMLFPSNTSAFRMGMAVDFNIPARHSLWGTSLHYGGRQELILKPWIISFSVPLKLRLGRSEILYATLDPALVVGWVTGDYAGPYYDLTFFPAPTFGPGFSGGLEIYPARAIGVNVKVGFRSLVTNIGWEDESSDTGYTQPLVNGEKVRPDLSGVYMTIGLILRLGR